MEMEEILMMKRRMIDVCCFQEEGWRGHGARMLGMKGRRYWLL